MPKPPLLDEGPDGPRGPVPVENQPGHHPPTEQDQPDPGAFAARFGMVEDPPEPNGGTEGAEPGWGLKGGQVPRIAALASAVVLLVGLVTAWRRRRSRR